MGRSSELAMYCGLDSETGVPQPITSSSHVASVHFHTDESISGRSDQGISGFMLTWAQVQGKFKNLYDEQMNLTFILDENIAISRF